MIIWPDDRNDHRKEMPSWLLRRPKSIDTTSSWLVRQVFRLLGAGFTITGLDGRPLVASEQAAFRLKADIRVHDAANDGAEILQIKADRIIDFSAAIR